MTSVEQVLAASLSPGDFVTEIDTPAGPWYRVVAANADALTIEGTPPEENGGSLMVTLVITADAHLLRRSR